VGSKTPGTWEPLVGPGRQARSAIPTARRAADAAEQRRPRAVTRRRPALSAQDGLCCREGYRPPVGAWDAVDRLTMTRPCGRSHVVVEADITGGFDPIEQGWWRRRLAARRADGACLRLIRQWLKAGGWRPMGRSCLQRPGHRRAGRLAPILAHVYRPDALDRWCHQGVKPRCRGEACLRRDADNGVCARASQADAERFDQEVGPRLSTFGLERSADKTRVIPFTRPQVPGDISVDGLGVACRWGPDRAGQPHLTRRTSRQKRRHARKRVTDWCQEQCRHRRKDWCRELHAKWRGYDHDNGVNGNAASLQEGFTGARRLLCPWLHRRRQRRSST
jgi:RNA-directed DNA polymerase